MRKHILYLSTVICMATAGLCWSADLAPRAATLLSEGTPVDMRLGSELSGLLAKIHGGGCAFDSFHIANEGIVDPNDEYPSYLIGTRAFHEGWTCEGRKYDLGGYLNSEEHKIKWLEICKVDGQIRSFCRD